MEVKLFLYTGLPNVVNKKLEYIDSVNCKLKGGVDLVSLPLSLQFEGGKFNYVVIPEVNKSYFVKNLTYNPHGVIDLNLEIDVVETYKDTLLNSRVVINEVYDENSYREDVKIVCDVLKDFDVVQSDKPIEYSKENILISLSN